MTLRLYYHPFSSFCQKVLIALYERDVSFEKREVNLQDEAERAMLASLWPLGKFPVLADEAANRVVAESSIIIEYLDGARPGAAPMIPPAAEEALEVRLWDRFFDNQLELPLQKIVGDHFRPDGTHDAFGVAQAKQSLAAAYAIIDRQLDGKEWAAGSAFSLADCAAAPALLYANILQPFGDAANLAAYFERLLARPSFARVVEEAKPFRAYFPPGWPDDYL